MWAVLLLSSSIRADIVAEFDFTGSPGNQMSEPAELPLPTGVASISNITRGGGISAQSMGDSINSAGWTEGSANDAVTAGDFYTFTITPAAGYTLTLTSIDFAEKATGAQHPTNFAVRSNISGATNLLTGTPVKDDLNTHQVTLGAAFQNLVGEVIFQLIGWGGNSAGLGHQWALMNGDAGGLVVNGTINAVPEPGAWLLGGVTCGTLGLGYGGRAYWGRLIRRAKG
jgi:hypothetical protein